MRDVGAAAERGRWAIRCTAMCSVLVFAGYAVTGFGAVRRAGSLETCGFKQAFWSLLGLRPKATKRKSKNHWFLAAFFPPFLPLLEEMGPPEGQEKKAFCRQ